MATIPIVYLQISKKYDEITTQNVKDWTWFKQARLCEI